MLPLGAVSFIVLTYFVIVGSSNGVNLTDGGRLSGVNTTNLTVATTLVTQSGYLYTTTPNVTLNGQAHIIDTRRVLVNGSAAAWTACTN